MADTRPRSGLSEVRLRKSGAGPEGASAAVKGCTTSRCFGSKASPGTNTIGYVSGVVLKSLCPRSANSAKCVERGNERSQEGFPANDDDPTLV